MPTKIEWAEETLNAVSGCTKVSEGCANCYAEKMAKRLQAMGAKGYESGFAVTLHPHRITEFFNLRKPSVVFWCSMGDLFHTDVPAAFIMDCLDAAWGRPEHTSIFLTKRAQRMANTVAKWVIHSKVAYLPRHMWFGVSTENQQAADERIPHLLSIPGKRFLSAEPLMGEIDITDSLPKVNAVIAGGESGPGARPCRPEWARALRDQCKSAGVPFTWKQWGQWLPFDQRQAGQFSNSVAFNRNSWAWSVGKKIAGRVLDGEIHNELPWGQP